MTKRRLFLFILLCFSFIGCTDSPSQDAQQNNPEQREYQEYSEPEQKSEHVEHPDDEKCSEPVIFTTPPANLEKVEWIVPLGLMSGNHVTPVDHQYYQARHDDQIEVTNPGDGVVTRIEKFSDNDWRLIIRHSCSMESIYIHIDKLSDKLMEHVPVNRRSNSPQVEVSEGEVIGWFDNNLDYNVVDYDIEIGLLNKESFSQAEQWKIHVQDPFLYFSEELQEKMIELSLRSEKPYGGKIDYDVDGTLLGMWFENGTNGYAGVNFPSHNYHQGHLAIAPHHIDPSYTIVSVGTYQGETEGYQFGVGNIDASSIGVGETVEWELYDYEYYLDGVHQDRWGPPKGSTLQNGQSVGRVSFELLEPRLLKADFGDGQRLYVR